MFTLNTPTRRSPNRLPLRFFFSVTAALVLAGCTTMQDIPAGTPVTQVLARHGAPTIECRLPDGTRHMVWSTQPMGQYAWATRVNPDETVGEVKQILTDTAFRQVEVGVWNAERMRCMFGPPAKISSVGLPSVRQTVWSYRYRQDGVWNSLMYVYFSDDGIVQRLHPGPDPLYDTRDWPFLM